MDMLRFHKFTIGWGCARLRALISVFLLPFPFSLTLSQHTHTHTHTHTNTHLSLITRAPSHPTHTHTHTHMHNFFYIFISQVTRGLPTMDARIRLRTLSFLSSIPLCIMFVLQPHNIPLFWYGATSSAQEIDFNEQCKKRRKEEDY